MLDKPPVAGVLHIRPLLLWGAGADAFKGAACTVRVKLGSEDVRATLGGNDPETLVFPLSDLEVQENLKYCC